MASCGVSLDLAQFMDRVCTQFHPDCVHGVPLYMRMAVKDPLEFWAGEGAVRNFCGKALTWSRVLRKLNHGEHYIGGPGTLSPFQANSEGVRVLIDKTPRLVDRWEVLQSVNQDWNEYLDVLDMLGHVSHFGNYADATTEAEMPPVIESTFFYGL